jgi:hypothetical protein
MILVFGSLNIDLIAHVPVIPGPGRTVLAPSYRTHFGGKAPIKPWLPRALPGRDASEWRAVSDATDSATAR